MKEKATEQKIESYKLLATYTKYYDIVKTQLTNSVAIQFHALSSTWVELCKSSTPQCP